MITVYFKEKVDDAQVANIYGADEAEFRDGYLVLTGQKEDEEGAIAPIEVVGMFRADYVIGWEKD